MEEPKRTTTKILCTMFTIMLVLTGVAYASTATAATTTPRQHFSDAALVYQTQTQPTPGPPTWNCTSNITTGTDICSPVTAQVDATSVMINWNYPTEQGDSPIVGYKIEVAPGPNYDTWTTNIDNTGDNKTYAKITGLTTQVNYKTRVSAINSAGAGTVSSASQWFNAFDPATAPITPTNVVGTPVSGGLSIAITVPGDTPGRTPVTRTRAFVFDSVTNTMAGSCDVVSSAGTTTKCVVTGAKNPQGVWVPLTQGTNYYVRGRTLGNNTWSPQVPYYTLNIG